MLQILQYLSLISAFLLPFLIGALVTSVKNKDRKKTVVCATVIAACLVIAGITIAIAFGLKG